MLPIGSATRDPTDGHTHTQTDGQTHTQTDIRLIKGLWDLAPWQVRRRMIIIPLSWKVGY